MPPVAPQDIPLEASETASFTPASFVNIPGAPSFTLRSPTKRDERHHRRLMREEGVQQHSDDAIRREIYAALEKLWSPADFAANEPRVRAYYEAIDAFALQRKDDPALVWEYDASEEQAVRGVIADAIKSWPALRRMTADNAEAEEMRAPFIAAIVVERWTGLATERRLDRGYLSVDCAEQLIEDLESFEREHKLSVGAATVELFVACMRRLYLGEEELGNSASSSPSTTLPASSNATAAPPTTPGKLKARGPSRKTPATA